jgi:hypothetical protein
MIARPEPDRHSCLPAGPQITAKTPRVNMDAVGGFAPEIACADVDHCGRHARNAAETSARARATGSGSDYKKMRQLERITNANAVGSTYGPAGTTRSIAVLGIQWSTRPLYLAF